MPHLWSLARALISNLILLQRLLLAFQKHYQLWACFCLCVLGGGRGTFIAGPPPPSYATFHVLMIPSV